MHIREFKESDLRQVFDLTHETIRAVNSADYSAAQCAAWIEGMSDEEKWLGRLLSSYTLIATEGEDVVGFINLEPDGYLDNIYAGSAHQARGIGSALLNAVEAKARAEGLPRLYAMVSVTAKPFFESKGFVVLREEFAPYRGQVFQRFEMQKTLG